MAITQHIKSLKVLEGIKSYLNMGIPNPKSSNHDVMELKIQDVDNIKRFIELFPTELFIGAKGLDYADFVLAMPIIISGAHKTPSGAKVLLQIKGRINTNRTDFSRPPEGAKP